MGCLYTKSLKLIHNSVRAYKKEKMSKTSMMQLKIHIISWDFGEYTYHEDAINSM